uniref:Uncharacterized protein n=1 Tax=Anguilla anguilla TaxID=7936 RepID=A0A0E9SRZ1_ANGAN
MLRDHTDTEPPELVTVCYKSMVLQVGGDITLKVGGQFECVKNSRGRSGVRGGGVTV